LAYLRGVAGTTEQLAAIEALFAEQADKHGHV